MDRIYTRLLQKHLSYYDQMVFISGPRQVGKTTISKTIMSEKLNTKYLNWDNVNHRKDILILNDFYNAQTPILGKKDLIILDEIHKYKDWKNFIKGFYDVNKEKCHLLLTGSSKLNIYRKGGDSLMGRYFNYTVHPLTVREALCPINTNKNIINDPIKVEDDLYNNLYKFGGFPEPFLKGEEDFHSIWQNLRFEQLFREDIRNAGDIIALDQLEVLALLLQEQSSGMVSYTNLALKVQVSNNTIKNWITLLENFYYCFIIKPWSKNLSRSLIKEPKVYLWDWSVIQDEGKKFENFIALHLYKAVNFWNETGKGKYSLNYLRTKEKKEVDFVITKNNQPWILIETKLFNNNSTSKNLRYFQEKLLAPYAFQVIHNMDYIGHSCFENNGIFIVPAKTLLSQLI